MTKQENTTASGYETTVRKSLSLTSLPYNFTDWMPQRSGQLGAANTPNIGSHASQISAGSICKQTVYSWLMPWGSSLDKGGLGSVSWDGTTLLLEHTRSPTGQLTLTVSYLSLLISSPSFTCTYKPSASLSPVYRACPPRTVSFSPLYCSWTLTDWITISPFYHIFSPKQLANCFMGLYLISPIHTHF